MEHSYQNGADELVLRLPDNSSLQYLVRRLKAFPIRYEDGETPVYLAGVSGVPSRYRLEKVLRESDLKLASVMNAVPGGIALYDLSGPPKLLYSNETLSRMCGYNATEYRAIMEKDYRLLIDPEDVPAVEEMILRFRRKPERVEGSFRIVTKDRSIRWVRVSAAPADNGLQCSVVFIDVTQDKENAQKNERMQTEILFRSEHDTLTGILNRETFYRKTAELLHAFCGQRRILLPSVNSFLLPLPAARKERDASTHPSYRCTGVPSVFLTGVLPQPAVCSRSAPRCVDRAGFRLHTG